MSPFARSPWWIAVVLLCGCGGQAVLSDSEDQAEIRCHAGYELVDGLCRIKEIFVCDFSALRRAERPRWTCSPP
ncbi:MAG: hypothetical protein HY744_19065 [Deltaproteobacteria bacterium]|nr:hypothetical protein [Deltaproteobacteria bacterium]